MWIRNWGRRHEGEVDVGVLEEARDHGHDGSQGQHGLAGSEDGEWQRADEIAEQDLAGVGSRGV